MRAKAKGPPLLNAPFLRALSLDPARVEDPAAFPLTIPVLAAEPLSIEFTSPVTLIVGPNGSGKSTILEAIAALCGFGRLGGSRDHFHSEADGETLSRYLRASWKPKVTRGFFTRAETFHGFINKLDTIARESGAGVYGARDGKFLSEHSHGEAYLAMFESRMDREGIYVLDEPEAALSPSRQMDFLRIVRRAEKTERAQFIIATHSPLLMAYPGATLLHLTDAGIVERSFRATDHFRILREFYANPEGFMEGLFSDM